MEHQWLSQLREQTKASSTLQIILGTLVAATVWKLYRFVVPARRHTLPVYKVTTNDVVSVLEKAHREVTASENGCFQGY